MCAAPGCSSRAELAPGIESGPVARRLLDAGLVRQRGHAHRVALRAVAARHRRRDRRRGRDPRQGARGARGMTAAARSRRPHSCASSPPCSTPPWVGSASRRRFRSVLDGLGRGAAVREAVGADAHVDRDGSCRARRPPDLHPARGGRSRRARAGRRRRRAPLPGTARSSRRACSTTPRSRRWRSVVDVPGGEPAVRSRPPAARRSPTSSRCGSCSAISRAAGSSSWVTATTSPRRSRSPPRCRVSSSRSRRRRVTSSTTTPSSARATSAARSSSRPIPTKRCAVPTRCTPTCGRRWARKTSRPFGVPRSRATRSTRR